MQDGIWISFRLELLAQVCSSIRPHQREGNWDIIRFLWDVLCLSLNHIHLI